MHIKKKPTPPLSNGEFNSIFTYHLLVAILYDDSLHLIILNSYKEKVKDFKVPERSEAIHIFQRRTAVRQGK